MTKSGATEQKVVVCGLYSAGQAQENSHAQGIRC